MVAKPDLHPHEMVAELDRYVVGQQNAKKALAVALRNRWRRGRMVGTAKDMFVPKNLLITGPSGSGKTLCAKRMAAIAGAPFVKVEATAFTEIGYRGRDVQDMIQELCVIARKMTVDRMRERSNPKLTRDTENRIIEALGGKKLSKEDRKALVASYREGQLDDREVTLELAEKSDNRTMMMFGFSMPTPKKKKTLSVKRARETLLETNADRFIDQGEINAEASDWVENHGIIFVDEIDKISGKGEGDHTNFRRGVQRDLLTLVEGTTVQTQALGPIRTDQILFIAAGAFHYSDPKDLMPEFQGRFPVRVKLDALSGEDLRRVLVATEGSLVGQYDLLLKTEGVSLSVDDDAIDLMVKAAMWLNDQKNENIGVRRLNGIVEKVFEPYLYDAGQDDDEARTSKIVNGKVHVTHRDVMDRLDCDRDGVPHRRAPDAETIDKVLRR